MSYQRERDEFIALMAREGMDASTCASILSAASTLQRCAELSCSSERADRDRVPCPTKYRPTLAGGECLCHDYGSGDAPAGDSVIVRHGDVPRIGVTEERTQRRIERLCIPFGVKPVFGGDPRGAVVKLRVPSGKTNDWGQDGICVPARGFSAAQMERICR